LDATTGMNALNQAREFNKAVPLSGLIVTKLDGTSKGGMVVAIQKELGLPIKFIGLGEHADDLQPFQPRYRSSFDLLFPTVPFSRSHATTREDFSGRSRARPPADPQASTSGRRAESRSPARCACHRRNK